MELAVLCRDEKTSEDAGCIERTGGMVGTTADECVPPVTHDPAPFTPA